MKKFFVVTAILLTAAVAFAALKGVPFLPEEDARFSDLEGRVDDLESAAVGGTLTDSHIIVGDSSDVAADVAMSGDATIDNAGAVTIAADAVGSSEIADGTVVEADLSTVGAASDGLGVKRVARVTFTNASSGFAVGAHASSVSLPAKALITRSYIYVNTQIVDTGTCTHAISCEDANNIKTATDLSGSAAGALIEGESTGEASAFVDSIAATCAITLTVADGGSCTTASAGSLTAFVEYVLTN